MMLVWFGLKCNASFIPGPLAIRDGQQNERVRPRPPDRVNSPGNPISGNMRATGVNVNT